jgi:hypothetical protein
VANQRGSLRQEGEGGSIIELVRDLGHTSADVVRDEVALARREVVDALNDLRPRLFRLVASAALALVALFWLSVSARDALAESMAGSQAALVVGLLLAAAAALMAWLSMRQPRRA